MTQALEGAAGRTRLDHQRRQGRQRRADPRRVRCPGARLRDQARRSSRHLAGAVALGAGQPRRALRRAAEPVSPALARFRHLDRAPDDALHSPAQAAGRARHLHDHPAEPEGAGQDGRPVLGAGARHAARAQRDHDADGAAQLHGPAPGPAAGERAARDRRAAAAARCRHARRPERGFPLHGNGAGATRLGTAVAGPPRGRADGHAVAAHAGADHRVRARGDGRHRRACSGMARATIPTRTSLPMPMRSSRRPTPST